MKKLKTLMGKTAGNGRRAGWRCANESHLAAYVDGGLDATARRSLEKHLADCESCLEQVSFLVRSPHWAESPDVPPWLITKAKGLVSTKQKAPIIFGWRWAAAGLAACLAIAFLVVLTIRSRTSPTNQEHSVAQSEQSPPAAEPSNPPRNPDVVAVASPPASVKPGPQKAEPSAPAVRNVAPPSNSPKILFPRDGTVVRRGPIRVEWQPVPDAVSYEVSILSETGDTVFSQSTNTDFLTISNNAGLIPGAKYFVAVRAQLRDGRIARSTISFRVAND